MFCEFREAHGGTMVDFIGELWAKVTEGIVGQSGKMEHCVEMGEVTCLNVAQILVQARNFNDFPDEAILSEIGYSRDEVERLKQNQILYSQTLRKQS